MAISEAEKDAHISRLMSARKAALVAIEQNRGDLDAAIRQIQKNIDKASTQQQGRRNLRFS